MKKLSLDTMVSIPSTNYERIDLLFTNLSSKEAVVNLIRKNLLSEIASGEGEKITRG